MLHAAAKSATPPVKSYIICKDAPCDTYSLPLDVQSSPPAVIAGHLSWGEPQNKFQRYRVQGSGQPTVDSYSCATNFRSPIARVVSCLYFRHAKAMAGECVSSMDAEKLDRLLRASDWYGDTCLNEPFRIMSGIRSTTFFDQLNTCRQAASGESAVAGAEHPDGPFDEQELRGLLVTTMQLTLKHLQKCSPLILEDEGSYKAASRRFAGTPVRFLQEDETMAHVYPNTNRKHDRDCSAEPWSDANWRLLRCHTAMENMLYTAVRRKAQCSLNGTATTECRL